MRYDLQDPLESRAKEGQSEAMRKQLEDDEFCELEFRAITIADYLKLDDVVGAHHRNLKLLELLTGKRPRQLKRMSAADYIGACKVMDEWAGEGNDDD